MIHGAIFQEGHICDPAHINRQPSHWNISFVLQNGKELFLVGRPGDLLVYIAPLLGRGSGSLMEFSLMISDEI
jgi:hypothetical protein